MNADEQDDADAAIFAALFGRYADPTVLAAVDREAVTAAIAAVQVEFPDYDPASCAPLIDWSRLRRAGETRDGYRARVEEPLG